jgi:TPR repeat protein
MTAIEWYRKAAAQGVKKAADKLERFRIILGHSHPRRRSSSIPLV